MPRGVHTSKRPSGFQQRKTQDVKKFVAAQSGSLLQFVKKVDNGHVSPQEQAHQSTETDEEDMELERTEPEQQQDKEIQQEDANEGLEPINGRQESKEMTTEDREEETHDCDDCVEREDEVCTVEDFTTDVSFCNITYLAKWFRKSLKKATVFQR